MNFGVGGNHSVILMSVRPNAPYRDRIEAGGTTLIYEGHDQPRGPAVPQPKVVDQLDSLPTGNPTQNGKFHRAAQDTKAGRRSPERVRVYEKIRPGIWSYNGIFHLVDSWTERDEQRLVYKFRLEAVEGEEDSSLPAPDRPPSADHSNSRKARSLETRRRQVRHVWSRLRVALRP